MPSDPHKNDVYLWEDSWPGWNKNHVTVTACRTLVYHACDAYKVQRPVVVKHPQRSFSWSMPTRNRISLQGGEHRGNGGLNVATTLHEAAHHIAYALYGDRIQDHGPTWLGVYLDLLIKARVAPEIALRASLRGFGIAPARQR